MSQAVVTPDQPAIAPDIAMDVLVPRKALAEIARLIDTATDLVRIEQLTRDGRLVVRTNKTSRVLVTRLLARTVPERRRDCLNQEPTRLLRFPARQLATAAQRVALMADHLSHGLRLALQPNRISVSASTESGDAARASSTSTATSR
jgi:DNA polymerase III sliding clamp (beta) subunit (PCNA family)